MITTGRKMGVVVLLVTALFGVLGLQWWSIGGRVISAKGKAPIADADVLITVHGRPMRSPIPHGWTASSRCLASRTVRTDAEGKFSMSAVTWGFAFVQKSFSVSVFKPALVSTGDTYTFPHHDPLEITIADDSVSSPTAVRHAIARAASMGWTMSGCDGNGERSVIRAMEWAIANMNSVEETNLVRLRCREALQRSLIRNRHSNLGTVPVLPGPWPNDVAPSCQMLLRPSQ